MTRHLKRFGPPALAAAAAAALAALPALAADLQPYVETARRVESGMSLWQLIRAGGGSMILLGLLSVAAGAFILYFFLYLRESRLAPVEFAHDVIDKLAARKFGLVRELCAGTENVVSKVVLAAIERVEKNPASAREAVELTAKKEVSKLWEALSYLSDIAVVAPLVGLLGTVLGMIDAFNAIAFQTAAVKPVLLAGGIAKAMVTTAAGLLIAIPASIFHSFFRSRVSKITATVEALASEITEILAEAEARVVSKR